MEYLDEYRINDMKIGMFNNKSYFGKSSKVLKSGVCKYMRRGIFDKLEWCIIEMMVFGLRKKALMSNIINRLKILVMEEIICSDINLIVELIDRLDKIEINDEWNKKIEYILEFCDILKFCKKGRICSYLNCWYRYNNGNYDLDNVVFDKILKYKKKNDSDELLKYGELLINFIENRDEMIVDIYNKLFNYSKCGRRYNRNDGIYLFWEIIEDIFKNNENFIKIFEFSKKIFYNKNLKERRAFGVWICLFIINYDRIDWNEKFTHNFNNVCLCDYFNNRSDIDIDDFVVNDMHVSKKYNKGDFVNNGGYVENEILDDLFDNGIKYRDFYKEKGLECISEIKRKKNNKDIGLDNIDFIDWNKFEFISIIDEGVCGGKIPCILVKYNNCYYVLKEMPKSLNFGRDYIFVDKCKKLFGLIDLDINRIKCNKGLVRIDNKIKNYKNNSEINYKDCVYVMMKYYANKGDLGKNKKLFDDDFIRIEQLKIRLFRGLFRCSDNINRNILVGENNELISIDENDIYGKRKNIFNKKGDYSIKYMKNDELEVVLNNIIDNKNFKENEIIKLMKEFGFDNKINDFIDRFNDYKNIVLSEIK